MPSQWTLTSTIGYGYRYDGVDHRHAAVARCRADVIQTHNGTKVYVEQTVPFLSRLVNNQVEHAREDLVFDSNGITMFINVAIVTPVSSTSGLTREPRRSSLNVTHTSTLSRLFWRPQAAPATMPRSSSAPSSPKNDSQLQPSSSQLLFAFSHFPCLTCPISGTTLIKSGKLGQCWVLNAMPSRSTDPAHVSTPAT